jgi:hypothetical protein
LPDQSGRELKIVQLHRHEGLWNGEWETKNQNIEKADPPDGESAHVCSYVSTVSRNGFCLFLRDWFRLEADAPVSRVRLVVIVLVAPDFFGNAFREGLAHGLLVPVSI